jgi:hypothetical protein
MCTAASAASTATSPSGMSGYGADIVGAQT